MDQLASSRVQRWSTERVKISVCRRIWLFILFPRVNPLCCMQFCARLDFAVDDEEGGKGLTVSEVSPSASSISPAEELLLSLSLPPVAAPKRSATSASQFQIPIAIIWSACWCSKTFAALPGIASACGGVSRRGVLAGECGGDARWPREPLRQRLHPSGD